MGETAQVVSSKRWPEPQRGRNAIEALTRDRFIVQPIVFKYRDAAFARRSAVFHFCCTLCGGPAMLFGSTRCDAFGGRKIVFQPSFTTRRSLPAPPGCVLSMREVQLESSFRGSLRY